MPYWRHELQPNRCVWLEFGLLRILVGRLCGDLHWGGNIVVHLTQHGIPFVYWTTSLKSLKSHLRPFMSSAEIYIMVGGHSGQVVLWHVLPRYNNLF